MKKHFHFYLINSLLFLSVFSCKNAVQSTSTQENPDSVRSEIMKIISYQLDAWPDETNRAKKIGSTLADSLVVVYEDASYVTSSEAYTKELGGAWKERLHDFTFRLYENTAVAVGTGTFMHFIGMDTLYNKIRVAKTFVKIQGEWKMVFSSVVSVDTTYNIKAVAVDPKRLQSYAGVYQFTKFSADTISVSDNKLFVASTGDSKPQDAFVPINDSTFAIKDDWAKIIFSRNASGKITHYIYVRPDGQRARIPKIK